MCTEMFPIDTILNFIDIIHRKYTRSYNIQSFFNPFFCVIFDKSILYRSRKLADVDPEGT